MSIATALVVAFALTPNEVLFDGPMKGVSASVESREQILETERGIVVRINANKPGAANMLRGQSWTNLVDYAGLNGEQYKDVFGVRSSGEQGPLLHGVVRNAIFGDLKRLLSNNERTCEDCGMTFHNLTCLHYDWNSFSALNEPQRPSSVNVGMFAPNLALLPGCEGESRARPFFDIPTPTSGRYGIRECVRSALVELGLAVTETQYSNYPKSVEEFARLVGEYDESVAERMSVSYSRFEENDKTLDDGWEYAVASAAFAHNRSYWSFGFHPTIELVGVTRHYTIEPEYEVEFVNEGTNRFARFTFSQWNASATESVTTNVVSRNSKITARRSCDTEEGRVGVRISGRYAEPSMVEGGYEIGYVELRFDGAASVPFKNVYCVNRYMSIEGVDVLHSWPSATSFGLVSARIADMPCGHASHPSDYVFAMIGEHVGQSGQEKTRYLERYDCESVESASSGMLSDITAGWFGSGGEYRVQRPHIDGMPGEMEVRYSGDYVVDVFQGGTFVGTVKGTARIENYVVYDATTVYDGSVQTVDVLYSIGGSWEGVDIPTEHEGNYFLMIYGCNNLRY